jgi:hypothetical protein
MSFDVAHQLSRYKGVFAGVRDFRTENDADACRFVFHRRMTLLRQALRGQADARPEW